MMVYKTDSKLELLNLMSRDFICFMLLAQEQ
jgi:hypothetical protein